MRKSMHCSNVEYAMFLLIKKECDHMGDFIFIHHLATIWKIWAMT